MIISINYDLDRFDIWLSTNNESDYVILKDEDHFYQKNYQNYIALVWSNSKLSETKIAVLPYQDAMKCLQYKTKKGKRRITITRIGAKYTFKCYSIFGPKFPKGYFVSSYANYMKYFDEKSQCEAEEE